MDTSYLHRKLTCFSINYGNLYHALSMFIIIAAELNRNSKDIRDKFFYFIYVKMFKVITFLPMFVSYNLI